MYYLKGRKTSQDSGDGLAETRPIAQITEGPCSLAELALGGYENE